MKTLLIFLFLTSTAWADVKPSCFECGVTCGEIPCPEENPKQWSLTDVSCRCNTPKGFVSCDCSEAMERFMELKLEKPKEEK